MKGCRPLTVAEEKKIWEYLCEKNMYREKLLFKVCRLYGLRIGEALALRVKSVTGKYLFIASEKGSDNQTFEVREDIRALAKDLFVWYKSKGVEVVDDMPLFLSQKGRHTKAPMGRNQVANIIRGICTLLGIEGKIGIHSMRKSFVMEMWEKSGHNARETKEYYRGSLNNMAAYIAATEGTPLIATSKSGFDA
jgi:integrase